MDTTNAVKRTLARYVAKAMMVGMIVGAGTVTGIVGCGGCTSSPQATSYKMAGTTVASADAAMKVWAAQVAAGKTQLEQEVVVRRSYDQYRAAMLVVIETSKAASSGGGPAVVHGKAIKTADLAQSNLVFTINSFLK